MAETILARTHVRYGTKSAINAIPSGSKPEIAEVIYCTDDPNSPLYIGQGVNSNPVPVSVLNVASQEAVDVGTDDTSAITPKTLRNLGDTGDANIILGSGSNTIYGGSQKRNSIAIGRNVNIQSDHSVGIGDNCTALGVAIGKDAIASVGTAIGGGSTSIQGIAVGNVSYSNYSAISIGTRSYSSYFSEAIGESSRATNNSVSVGYAARSNQYGISIGHGAGGQWNTNGKDYRIEISNGKTDQNVINQRLSCQKNGEWQMTVRKSDTAPISTDREFENDDGTLPKGMYSVRVNSGATALVFSYNDNGIIKTSTLSLS